MDKKSINDRIKLLRIDLRRKIITAKKGDVAVIINGNLDIIDISLPQKIKPETVKTLKAVLSKAIAKAQKQALKFVQESSC